METHSDHFLNGVRLSLRDKTVSPDLLAIHFFSRGASGTGKLLILSQVILAFQLPFAIVPLVMFTRNRAKMGALASPSWLTVASAVIAAIIIGLNAKMVYDLAFGG